IILITSGMTYWYPGVFEAIKEVKSYFPGVPVVLGGTYATLCYEHALKNSGADHIICGEGEIKALKLVQELIGGNVSFITENLDDYPYPSYNLLTSQNSLAILTSRGCPMGCTYCASKIVAGDFRQRNPIKVADEIAFYHKTFGTKNFAFYDDALLLKPDEHISVILKEIIGRGINCNFHTPNAMHASQISKPLARLMFKAGFKTIRISLETSNVARQKDIGNKVTPEALQKAIINLKEAGYKGKDVGVYVLICLPGQPLEEMIESVRYVYECGAMTKLAVYSPIPQTEEWEKAVEYFGLDSNADPLLHNDSIYPVRLKGITTDDIQKVKALALEYNKKLESDPNSLLKY
ncbi:MAG: radical SAM protein, partial [Candidatus Poribacteria bacterium]